MTTNAETLQRFENSISINCNFNVGLETPRRMQQKRTILQIFGEKGLTSPEIGFITPEDATDPDKMYPTKQYSMGFADQRFLNRLTDIAITKREEYLSAGISVSIVDDIISTIIEVAVAEVGSRENDRKMMVKQEVSKSLERKKNTKPRGIEIDPAVIKDAYESGDMTEESISSANISDKVLQSVLDGKDRVTKEVAARLAVAANLPVDEFVEDRNQASQVVELTTVFCTNSKVRIS